MVASVAEVKTLSDSYLWSNFISLSRPVVIRGLAAGWPALDRWNPEFFVRNYGEAQVHIADRMTGRLIDTELRAYFKPPFKDSPRYYLVDWNFRKTAPRLLDDIQIISTFNFDFLQYLPEFARPDLLWIYMGHLATQGQLHMDDYGSSAWLAVVSGRKVVRFVRKPNSLAPSALMAIDPFDEGQVARLPDVCEVADATLSPGDVLYIPSGVWHAASNLEFCISVTANFVNGASFDSFITYGRRSDTSGFVMIKTLEALKGKVLSAKDAVNVDLAIRAMRKRIQEEQNLLDALEAWRASDDFACLRID